MRCEAEVISDFKLSEKDECIERRFMIMSVSNAGKCYTFLSSLSYSNETFSEWYKHLAIFVGIYKEDKENLYTMLIHDRNELPSLTFTDYFGETPLKYSMTRVNRLSPPYNSNCFDYKSSKSFKSRGHCMDFLINKILKRV